MVSSVGHLRGLAIGLVSKIVVDVERNVVEKKLDGGVTHAERRPADVITAGPHVVSVCTGV